MFQFESEGIRELLKRMKPDNIRDLIAVLALYRPGPLDGGMVDSYVEPQARPREAGSTRTRCMEEVLDETYGVMVYQEQVMRILNRLGGIELSECVRLHQGDQQEEEGHHRRRARPTSSAAAKRARPRRESRPRTSST